MHRPKDLLDAVEHDAVARFFARVIRREAAMIWRMPVLRRDDEIETSLQFIGQRKDLVAARDCQRASRQKIILKIDNDQRIHFELSRCSLACAINVDLSSCNDFSRPTL